LESRIGVLEEKVCFYEANLIRKLGSLGGGGYENGNKLMGF
jgi:hypothetical protein